MKILTTLLAFETNFCQCKNIQHNTFKTSLLDYFGHKVTNNWHGTVCATYNYKHEHRIIVINKKWYATCTCTYNTQLNHIKLHETNSKNKRREISTYPLFMSSHHIESSLPYTNKYFYILHWSHCTIQSNLAFKLCKLIAIWQDVTWTSNKSPNSLISLYHYTSTEQAYNHWFIMNSDITINSLRWF